MISKITSTNCGYHWFSGLAMYRIAKRPMSVFRLLFKDTTLQAKSKTDNYLCAFLNMLKRPKFKTLISKLL